jgi:putative transposase
MQRKEYATDLTDPQWREMEPMIPPARAGGRPRGVDMREIVNGIRYLLRAGCAWRLLPHEFPNWHTCWFYYNRFCAEGVWQRMAETLHSAVRARAGRDPLPSQAIVDAQSVKTTKKGATEARSVMTRARR